MSSTQRHTASHDATGIPSSRITLSNRQGQGAGRGDASFIDRRTTALSQPPDFRVIPSGAATRHTTAEQNARGASADTTASHHSAHIPQATLSGAASRHKKTTSASTDNSVSPVTTIIGAPEHELCVIFRKKTDRLDQKTGTTAPPKPRKKRIYTCHTCGRIGHSSTYCHRYPPDPIPSNTQPAQSQSSQPQQTLTNVRISPALPSYTTTTATNTSLNEKTWLYDARERETRIDNSRKEARDLNRFKQRTKQPQKFDKLAPQKDRITSNPALKLQVKTLELTFSGRKLSIKSIRAQLRCALNRH